MRVVHDGFIDPDVCARVRSILDRHGGPPRPGEEQPESMTIIDDVYAMEPTRTSLADLAVLETVRAAVLEAVREVCEVNRPGGRRLTTDQTSFKRATGGHFKQPHDDTDGSPQRIFTAVVYFKDATSGAIVFGRNDEDGRFTPTDHFLPAEGRLVIFDDAAENTHAVEPFVGEARYSMMMWFRVASEHERSLDADWMARWFFINPSARLALTAQGLTLNGATLTIEGATDDDDVEVELETSHAAWIPHLATARPSFSIDALSAAQPQLDRFTLLELLVVLANADAVALAPG